MAAVLTPLERELVDSLKRTAKNLCTLSPEAQAYLRPLVEALEVASSTVKLGKQIADTTVSVRFGDLLSKLVR